MKPKKLNAQLLWMQFEDVLAPRLGLSVKERAVYSYLLRHSLVVGKLRLQFAVMALARDLGLAIGAARQAVRRLDELGALRVLERSKSGHLAVMRMPEKIRAVRLRKNDAFHVAGEPPAATLETTDFLKSWALRKAIHDREAAPVFTAFAALPLTCIASTTSCHACASGAIPTATWFPVVSSATRARTTVRPGIFCARSTAWGA